MTIGDQGAIVRLATLTAKCLCIAILCLPAWPTYAQTSQKTLEQLAAGYAKDLCSLCHDQHSGKELAPRIAGQQRAYIEAQLYAFRRTSRAEPEAYDCMWGLSSALSDELVAALAAHFASQSPRPGILGDPAQVEAGRELFNRTDREYGISSCAQCHGEDAVGAEAFPRLAGQLAPYLGRQMKVIRSRFRDSGIMHGIVKDLSDQDLGALAIYLQSL